VVQAKDGEGEALPPSSSISSRWFFQIFFLEECCCGCDVKVLILHLLVSPRGDGEREMRTELRVQVYMEVGWSLSSMVKIFQGSR
jgi:hypothetical protein